MAEASRIRQIFSQTLSPAEAVGLQWVWTLIGCLWFGRIFFNIYLPAPRGFDVKGYVLGHDFVNVWAGAKLVLEGKIASLYPIAEYNAALSKLLGLEKYKPHNFSYPPHILPLILVFGVAGYFPSLAAWTLLGMAALAAVMAKQPHAVLRWPAWLLVAVCPANLMNIVSGQNGAFTAALFLGGFYFAAASPVLAGVLFGLLTVKPHLGILVIPALLLVRNWKCMASAAATSLALAGVTFAVWGVAPWHDFFTIAAKAQGALLFLDKVSFYSWMMPGPYADAAIALGLPMMAAAAVAAVAGVYALWVSLKCVQAEGLSARSVLMLALATIVILPYGFNYDLVMVAGALAVYLASGRGVMMGHHLVYGMLWALPLAVIEMKGFSFFPFSSAIMIGALWLLHRERRAVPSPMQAA